MRVYRISRIEISTDASADFFSRPDIFLKLSYGTQHVQSAVKWDITTFVFTQPFWFEHEESVFDLRVEVFDKDRWSPDELLLDAVFDLSKSGVCNSRGITIEFSVVEALSAPQLDEVAKKHRELADALDAATRANLQLADMTSKTTACRHVFVVDLSERAERTVYICTHCGVDRRS